MTDMLVKLYDLPPVPPAPPPAIVRRMLAPEKHLLIPWIADTFSVGWADECNAACSRQPPACFVAVADGRFVGFCVYDGTARGLLGPIGVAPALRRCGLGAALLHAALADMRARGYAYAVVGWVQDEAFFADAAGAVPIPGSEPGLYRGLLRDPGRRVGG
jgi:GNAT superfamily N-acetyltransferase